jgi:hypothetical protein
MNSGKLPLDDPRWLPLQVPHSWLMQRGSNREWADHDLTVLLRTDVHSMVRLWPSDERRLLPFSYWDEGEHYVSSRPDKVQVFPQRPISAIGPKGPLHEDAFYAWGPDLKKIRPASAAPRRPTPHVPKKKKAEPVKPPTRQQRVGQAILRDLHPEGVVPETIGAATIHEQLKQRWRAKCDKLFEDPNKVYAPSLKTVGRWLGRDKSGQKLS